jgi:hypothetical protein
MANELKFGNKVVFLNGLPLTLPIAASDQFSESATLGSALGLTLTSDISGGNIRILYNNTHASNAATMHAHVRRLRA